ncbi:MAG: hypothetical protein J0I45_00010 [Bosea sp.]|nr:hypothetical protein [Bosea sp. (in: a-proteobacteria)]
MTSNTAIIGVKDGNGVLFGQLVYDQSGVGTGPFFPLATFADKEGAPITPTNPLAFGNAQLATVTATIASGASLSGAADLGTGRLVGLIFPAAWTTAAITFQGSADGSTFFDLYDDATERAIASSSVVPSRFLALPIADWLMIRAVKLRSGSAATPVVQGAARSITLVTAR